MKNKRRWTQELNTLSAYLDGELSIAEQEKLEALLNRETDLRDRLEALRKTRLLVRRLPRQNAPHNFTLTADMVEVYKKNPQPLVPILRLASSLAAILLVVLFGVELLIGGRLQFGSQLAAKPMMEAAKFADDAAQEPLILWGASDVDGMGGAEFAPQEPMLEMVPVAPEAEMEEELPAEAPETETMALPDEEVDMFSAQDRAAGEDQLILGINTNEGGDIIQRSEPAAHPSQARLIWRDPLRLGQLALAVIAVGGGVTLYALHHKRLNG